jgi:hypothetical protein
MLVHTERKCRTVRNTSRSSGFGDGFVTESDGDEMLGDEREELIQSQEVSEDQGSNVQVCAAIRKI